MLDFKGETEYTIPVKFCAKMSLPMLREAQENERLYKYEGSGTEANTHGQIKAGAEAETQAGLRCESVGENVAVEFKRCGNGISADTYETVCSFLNRFGADIYLGVEDSGNVAGIPDGADIIGGSL